VSFSAVEVREREKERKQNGKREGGYGENT